MTAVLFGVGVPGSAPAESWAAGPSSTEMHPEGVSALLPDGETATVDIYNPATNEWSSGAPLPSPPEPTAISAEAQTLSDGQVVVIEIGSFGNGTAICTPAPAGHPCQHLCKIALISAKAARRPAPAEAAARAKAARRAKAAPRTA